jgi:hypothetical protein
MTRCIAYPISSQGSVPLNFEGLKLTFVLVLFFVTFHSPAFLISLKRQGIFDIYLCQLSSKFALKLVRVICLEM